MTLPDERYRAVRYARDFLINLSQPKATPRVPKYLRDQAHGILKHYPTDFDLWRICRASPEVMLEHLEPLAKMILEHKQEQEEKQMTAKIKKIERVNDSLVVYRYDNGWMVEIGGRNTAGDYKTTKITCNTEDELVALIKEYNSLPLDD